MLQVTVWKNLSNFVTACGDVVIYKKTYTFGVWSVLFLMLASAFVGELKILESARCLRKIERERERESKGSLPLYNMISIQPCRSKH